MPESRPAPVRGVDQRRWRAAVALGLVGLAHLPWLAAQGRLLWAYPHYQFVPFVPLGAAALAVRDGRRLGPLTPGDRRWSAGLLATSLLLMALAAVLWSPCFGTLAALTTLLALAQSWGGARLVRAMLPAWAFLWVAVRPPMGLDIDLIFALQSVATRWSSRVLDLLGVFHVAAGHVIEVVDRRLLVEEACSGIYSLFVALTATLFYVLWVRRGWLSSLLLFAAATAWVMVGNVVRIVTTTVLWSRWGVDINSGWKHELFGLLILVLTVGLILSTDRLLQTALGVVRRVWSERHAWWSRQSWDIPRSRFARGGAGAGDDRTAPEPGGGGPDTRAARGEADDPGEPTRWPPARRVWLASWPAMAVFGLLGLWQLTVAARGALHGAPAPGWNLAPTLERTFASLKADDLPDRVGPYRREGFAVERNAVPGIMAEHARVWIYRSPRATAVVSADYPFVGWHEVTTCYQGQGWIIGERKVEAGEAEGAGPRVAAGMVRPLDRIGLLVFALDDERSEPLSPPSGGWRALLRERWSSGLRRLLGGQPSGASGVESGANCQIQVLWYSEEPPTPADQLEVRELFEKARAACRRHNLGIAKAGARSVKSGAP